MHELPAEHSQGPSTDGPWPATSVALREFQPVHELIGDVHKHGPDNTTYQRPDYQIHKTLSRLTLYRRSGVLQQGNEERKVMTNLTIGYFKEIA